MYHRDDHSVDEAGHGRRGPKINSRRRAYNGKENVCPLLLPQQEQTSGASSRYESSFVSPAVGESRSPLPEGFPRVPLQDITHILSPLKAPSDGNAGDNNDGGNASSFHCKAQKESLAQVASTEHESHTEVAHWKGLRKCTSATAAHRHAVSTLASQSIAMSTASTVKSFHQPDASKPHAQTPFHQPDASKPHAQTPISPCCKEDQAAAGGQEVVAHPGDEVVRPSVTASQEDPSLLVSTQREQKRRRKSIRATCTKAKEPKEKSKSSVLKFR